MDKTAFYIGHGVEMRHFVLSGFLDEVRKCSDVVLLIRPEIQSFVLNEYIDLYKIQVIHLPPVENKKSSYIEGVIRSLHDARKRYQHLGLYRHFGVVGKGNKFTDFIKGNRLTVYIGDRIGRYFLIRYYYDRLIAGFLTGHKFTSIYMLEYGSHTIGSVASKLELKLILFINTLKTVFINDFIPYKISAIHTWNTVQEELFRNANPGLSDDKFKNTGTPFHRFLRRQDVGLINQIRTKYGLTACRPVIVYSMIFEKVFAKEHLVIEKLNDFFERDFENANRPLLVVRRNPFEENSDGVNYMTRLSNVLVADHYWERNAAKNWSIQGIKGEIEWRALLQFSSICMNIPSMSTIDSLMCGTPVINIGFDETGNENRKIEDILHAPFVKEFEKSKFVRTFTDFRVFKSEFMSLIELKKKVSTREIQDSLYISKSELPAFI